MMPAKIEHATALANEGGGIEDFYFMGAKPFQGQPGEIATQINEGLAALSSLLWAVNEDLADARDESRDTEVSVMSPRVIALVHDHMQRVQAVAAYFAGREN